MITENPISKQKIVINIKKNSKDALMKHLKNVFFVYLHNHKNQYNIEYYLKKYNEIKRIDNCSKYFAFFCLFA